MQQSFDVKNSRLIFFYLTEKCGKYNNNIIIVFRNQIRFKKHIVSLFEANFTMLILIIEVKLNDVWMLKIL